MGKHHSLAIIGAYRGKNTAANYNESAVAAAKELAQKTLKPSLWLNSINLNLKDIMIIDNKEGRR